jgi:hypothetical protein
MISSGSVSCLDPYLPRSRILHEKRVAFKYRVIKLKHATLLRHPSITKIASLPGCKIHPRLQNVVVLRRLATATKSAKSRSGRPGRGWRSVASQKILLIRGAAAQLASGPRHEFQHQVKSGQSGAKAQSDQESSMRRSLTAIDKSIGRW